MLGIELDVTKYVDLVEKPQETALGPVTFELVTESGPANCPIVRATGESGALLLWLLDEYTAGDVNDAVYRLTGTER